mgnify:CR=1 FL=1|tara:strand:+ start:4743 stop:5390 length:648 start_codon:yes stop_codon:yes gene_type:complete
MSIQVFYHMYCVNNYIERFLNTYNKIVKAELINTCKNINITIIGENQTAVCSSQIKDLEKVKTTYPTTSSIGETDTLRAIYQHCQNNPNDKILYLHSKGATRGANLNVQAWVDYMEYFLIEKYDKCLQKLKNYDTVGVEYSELPKQHYSGNFWWANASYINTLRPFETGLQTSIINNPRWYCEFWLLDNICNPCSLHQSCVDLYATEYKEHNYKL